MTQYLDDHPIPKCLTKKRKKKKLERPDTGWVTPKPRETRSSRRHRKSDQDKLVTSVISGGAETFHKIRKELGDGWETNDISNAIRRCIKSRNIEQVGRRYYPLRRRG